MTSPRDFQETSCPGNFAGDFSDINVGFIQHSLSSFAGGFSRSEVSSSPCIQSALHGGFPARQLQRIFGRLFPRYCSVLGYHQRIFERFQGGSRWIRKAGPFASLPLCPYCQPVSVSLRAGSDTAALVSRKGTLAGLVPCNGGGLPRPRLYGYIPLPFAGYFLLPAKGGGSFCLQGLSKVSTRLRFVTLPAREGRNKKEAPS